ncbi:ribosome-binding protein 1b isoform X2 [Centropristis striata]|uniref:ribosome-binding protein 1b isoform X2 n=1 Tax=Centropristis striata TaxID=184440 RepID=UPI0027E13406|nr:ribosome-binding protein 1b isoform X2 [Centropristis striata]
MDVSDPQTLGFMVFGGFMFISAVGIALVSTLSMKETSYEEALAKQRRGLVHTQPPRADKKKKDKSLEKKNKAKKKEDRPEEKAAEPGCDGSEEPEAAAGTDPESDPEPAAEPTAAPEPKPTPEPEPVVVTAVAAAVESPPAPSPKEKKKKKLAKAEPAAAVETIAKEVLVMAVAPVVEAPPVNVISEITKEPTATKTEEPKETTSKKKKKNKAEPVNSTGVLPLYGELLAAVSAMTLSDHEIHKLIEVLNQKAGVRHDSWQLACQKGDPLSTLKKQLEEKEKLLTSEQEGAAVAKTRLRELSKELGAEKSKLASLDTRLKAELSAQVQKVNAVQIRMDTAEQEHLKQTQQLNQKIVGLQEQLENGPNAQLARLQQENSILRDALNQATSLAESRQNAELARLRQDCARLGRELAERSDALRSDEERRRSLEAKTAAAEQELARAQALREDSERALQQRLEEVRLELNASQQEAAAAAELQGVLASRESELQELRVQLESQAALQAEHSTEVEQLSDSVRRRDEQVVSLEAELARLRAELQLLTSSQSQRETEDETADQTHRDGSGSETEFESLEKDSQLLRLEEEVQQLREELQQSTGGAAGRQEAELKSALAELESRSASLRLDFQAALQVLFPGVAVETEKSDWLQLFTHRVQEERSHSESRLNEQTEEQTDDQNTKVLQDTQAELQALQQCYEQQETIWKNKLSEAEQQKQMVLDQLKLLEDIQSKRTETEDIQQLKEQLMLLEAQLEKQLEEASYSQSCGEELAQVQAQVQQLSVRLQVEQQQRHQLDAELQKARQEVLELQQRLEAEPRSAVQEEVVQEEVVHEEVVHEEAVQEETVQVQEEMVQVQEEMVQVQEEMVQVQEETVQVQEEMVQVQEETVQVQEETVQEETVQEEAVQVKEETPV